jgi:hypothetical protein
VHCPLFVWCPARLLVGGPVLLGHVKVVVAFNERRPSWLTLFFLFYFVGDAFINATIPFYLNLFSCLITSGFDPLSKFHFI